MFEITLTQALALYTLLLTVVVASIWLYTELSVRHPQRHLGKQFLWSCNFCGCTYLDEAAGRISKCPRCESYNEASEAASSPMIKKTAQPESEHRDAQPTRNTSKRRRHHQKRRGPRRRR